MKKELSAEDRESIILDIIAKEFDVPLERLQPSVSLIEGLGADSLSLMNVMMQVEEALEIEMPEEEWRSLRTVGDIVSRIRTVPAMASAAVAAAGQP